MKIQKRNPTEIHENPYDEAMRYLANADKTLADNTTIEYGDYSDSKYVKAAGHLALCGIYVALDPLFPKNKKPKHKTIEAYIDLLAKRNRKIMITLKHAYDNLHLYMGYDGNTDVDIKKLGWKNAKAIIEWAKENYPKNLQE